MISAPVHPLLSELKEYKKLHYRDDLSTDNWSNLRLFSHIINKSNEFLDFVEQYEFVTSSTTKERTRFGNLVFLYGEVPWVRVTFQDDFNIESESNSDYTILVESARQLVSRIDQVKMHARTIDPSKKIYHNELGWLNTSDWLHWLDIHVQYHLRKR